MKMTEKELQLVLEEGEGYRIEFKETFSGLDKEMVAFANASGGRMFLGISDDNKITGVRINNKLKSQVQDIANNCQPPPSYRLYREDGNRYNKNAKIN
jgi:ATP-dependent DNA helicase RecG